MRSTQKARRLAPKKVQRRSRVRSDSAITRKVIVEFPETLLKRTEEAAAKLSTDRSKLIRSAVESYLERQKRTELEAALAEGYREHADLDRQIAEEFAYSDSENL
jgi:metal-responsive CopG/Arc/MetJ family transcriptional regulator